MAAAKTGGKGKGGNGKADPFKAPKEYDKAAVKAGARVGQNDDGDDDGFDQGGPDGPAKQRGQNSREFTPEDVAEQVGEFLELMDEIEAAVASNNRDASLKNQPLRKRLAKAQTVLVKDGVVSSEVLARIKQKHKLERKAESVDSTLNDEQKNEFEAVLTGLKGLVGTPLGDAAIQAAEAATRPH
jgi:hypothetical protein